MWPAGEEHILSGILCKDVFAAGATKEIYKVSTSLNLSIVYHWHAYHRSQLFLNDSTYVAKRFINIGSDGPITASENERFLKAELIRLKLGAWFLGKFFEDARALQVDVHKGMNVYGIFDA